MALRASSTAGGTSVAAPIWARRPARRRRPPRGRIRPRRPHPALAGSALRPHARRARPLRADDPAAL